MQERFAVLFGALLVAAALMASHPINPQTWTMLGERLAGNWYEVQAPPACDDSSVENCLAPTASP